MMLRRTKQVLPTKLPEKKISLLQSTFSKEEQDFYSALEKKSQLKFNEYVAAGTVMKNYTNVLILILRLRQACDHPYLVTKSFGTSNALVDEEKSVDLCQVNTNGGLIERVLDEGRECPICFDVADDGDTLITHCGHVFCGQCLLSYMESSPEKTCPVCRQNIEQSPLVTVSSFKRAQQRLLHQHKTANIDKSDDKNDNNNQQNKLLIHEEKKKKTSYST